MNRYQYNQDWYTIKYGLAALYANEWIRNADAEAVRRQRAEASGRHSEAPVRDQNRGSGRDLRDEALTEATALTNTAFDTLDALDGIWIRLRRPISRRRRSILKSYLNDAMVPATMVLLAGLSPTPRAEEDDASLQTREGPGLRYPAQAEGAAPEEATTAVAEPTPAGPPDTANADGRVPSEIRAAIATRRANPVDLLEFVVRLKTRDPRVTYNLACTYAVRCMDGRALDLLAESIRATPIARRPGLAKRALNDPSLATIVPPGDVAKDAGSLLKWAEQREVAGRASRPSV